MTQSAMDARPPSAAFRAAPPHNQIRPQLGPLADLPGMWVGKGFNLVALPDKQNNRIFRLMVYATTEFINFTLTGAPIPDRGFKQDDLFFVGVHYFQQVVDATTSAGLHLETGMWLNLPETEVAGQGPLVTRMSTIPHGDALLAQGPFLTVEGGPQIDAISTAPFKLDAAGQPDTKFPLGYLDPYFTAVPPAGVPKTAISNPNQILIDAIQGQHIVKTIVFTVNANPVGGINGQPVVPPAQQTPIGGILNIPFVQANADANSLSATFWIETVQNADGSSAPIYTDNNIGFRRGKVAARLRCDPDAAVNERSGRAVFGRLSGFG